MHWLSYFVFLAQVTRPVPFPCFGVLKKEKHVLLPSVQDIVIEQGKSSASFPCSNIQDVILFHSFEFYRIKLTFIIARQGLLLELNSEH